MNNEVNDNAKYNASSNLSFINTSMDKLSKGISTLVDSNQSNHIFESKNFNNNLYDSINNVSKKYFSAEKYLLEKLQNEVKLNLSLGKKYESIDTNLEEETKSL